MKPIKNILVPTDFSNTAQNALIYAIKFARIEEFIETRKADLLAMMPRKRGLFESMFHSSLTKKMAFHTHIPLLAFYA